jgi:hypothetical protein
MDAVRGVGGAILIYFSALFTALGLSQLVRELMSLMGLEPLLGQIAGALIVALILLPSAGFAVRTFDVPARFLARLAIGVGAVALMLAVGALELVFFRRVLEEQLHVGREPTVLPLALGLLVFAAIVPLFMARRVD